MTERFANERAVPKKVHRFTNDQRMLVVQEMVRLRALTPGWRRAHLLSEGQKVLPENERNPRFVFADSSAQDVSLAASGSVYWGYCEKYEKENPGCVDRFKEEARRLKVTGMGTPERDMQEAALQHAAAELERHDDAARAEVPLLPPEPDHPEAWGAPPPPAPQLNGHTAGPAGAWGGGFRTLSLTPPAPPGGPTALSSEPRHAEAMVTLLDGLGRSLAALMQPMIQQVCHEVCRAVAHEASGAIMPQLQEALRQGVRDAVYDIRKLLGTPTDYVARQAAAASHEAPPAQLPEKFHRPKVCVIGLTPDKWLYIRERFPALDFRMLNASQDMKTLGDIASKCDATILMTRYLNNKVQGAMGTSKVQNVQRCNGTVDELQKLLHEHWDQHPYVQSQGGARASAPH